MQHVYIFFPVNKPIFLLVELSQFYELVFVSENLEVVFIILVEWFTCKIK